MSKKGKKWHEENALFLGKSGKFAYNNKCRQCVNDCKQSSAVVLVCCPDYRKK